MNEQPIERSSWIDRERALYLYNSALEEGDFDTVASVLEQAQQDTVLETMLLEVEGQYRTELDQQTQAADTQLVRELLVEHLSAFDADELTEETLPQLTVGDVVARLQSDGMLKGPIEKEISGIAQRLRQVEEPLPENLSLRGVRRLFERLGLTGGERFQRMFRETAILLSMGREQGNVRLAATRRQRELRRSQAKEEVE